jgi:hypothetical protein
MSVTVDVKALPETLRILVDLFTPWKREHGKVLARLEEQEKKLMLKQLEGQVGKSYTKDQLEIEKERLEIEKLRIEIEKKRLEVDTSIINLANQIVEQSLPKEVPYEQKILYIQQTTIVVKDLCHSPLEFEAVDSFEIYQNSSESVFQEIRIIGADQNGNEI